jgi:hypothetical protein
MSTEPLNENEIQEFVYWMENSAPALVDSTANGLVDYSKFSQSGQVVDASGVLLPHLNNFFAQFKTGTKVTKNNTVNPDENIIQTNIDNNTNTTNTTPSTDPIANPNVGALGGNMDLVNQLIPDQAPIDPALVSLLYFSKMGELANQPGSTLLGSAVGAFTSPAEYLMQREADRRTIEKNRATLAANLARQERGGTARERMRNQVLKVAEVLSTGGTLGPNDFAQLAANIRELKEDKVTTLPNGSQVKESGINMMEIIRQTYGEKVYNAIVNRLSGVDIGPSNINQESENKILFGNTEVKLTGEKDLTAPQATAIANANSAINNLKIARDYFLGEGVDSKEFRFRLLIPSFFGEKRTATGALRRALEILLRLRTGAAAPQSEVDSYMGMYAPSRLDTKRNVEIKFRDMLKFFESIRGGITRSENYTYDAENNTSTPLDVDLAEEIPNLDAQVSEDVVTNEGITIKEDGTILIEVNQ